MKVLIVGLGMIGASYAQGLTNKGYIVYGVSRKIETIKKAMDKQIIVSGSLDVKDYLDKVELIILATYPEHIKKFMNEFKDSFLPNQIITDVAGVKEYIQYLPKIKAEFIGSHPMAGSEKSGIDAMNLNVFKNANFLITPFNNSKEAISMIRKMAKDLGFGTVTTIDPQSHDKMIAFTSQLTHAIAVSLVNSDHNLETPKFTGDSYRDLTRIAMINEELWSELFISNKKNLLEKINDFEEQINILKKAIYEEDLESLQKIFAKAKEIRKRF